MPRVATNDDDRPFQAVRVSPDTLGNDPAALLIGPIPDYKIGDVFDLTLPVEVCHIHDNGTIRVRGRTNWGGYRYWDFRPPDRMQSDKIDTPA